MLECTDKPVVQKNQHESSIYVRWLSPGKLLLVT